MTAACHEPGNSKPQCIMSDVLDTLTKDNAALKLAHHTTVSAISGVKAEVSAVRTETRRANQKLDRLVEGMKLGNIQPAPLPVVEVPTVSIPDWDPDEPTLSGREPEVAATIWKVRANDVADKIAQLQADLAAAHATIEATEAERNRQSDRAAARDDRRWSKWQKIGGIVVAIITALGGGVGLAQLLK